MAIPRFRLNRKASTAQGLVGLWGLGSPSGLTLFDRSGRSNHGTLTDMDPATDWVATEKGWALDFVTNDSVQVSNFMATGDYSITAWIWADAFTSIAGDALVDNSIAPFSGFRFFVRNSGGNRLLKLQNDFAFAEVGAVSVNEVPTGQWAHIGGTSRNTGATSTCKVYIDGILEATNASAGDYVQNGSNVAFGYRPTGSGSSIVAHDGRLTDIRIYNRVLSDVEVHHIYQSTRREPYSDLLLRPRRIFKAPAAPLAGAIMNQFQGSNLGADLYNGTISA